MFTLLISILSSLFFFTLGWHLSKKNQLKKNHVLFQDLEKKHKKKSDQLLSEQSIISDNFFKANKLDLEQKGLNLNNAFLENGRTLELISSELKNAQTIVESAFSSLPNIYTSSQNTKDATRKSKEKINALSQSVDSWGSSMDTLGNIQGLIEAIHQKAIQIRDVSSEANLLALNASIEAARAGKHGKGFAVVATSMRELSNKSADATVEINSAVERTRSEVEKIVNGISESVSLLSKVSIDVSESFADIEVEVDNIDKISQSSLAEAELSKDKFKLINNEVNTQLESITRLLADVLGEVTGSKIENISVSSDFTGMKIIDVRRPDEFTGELGHIPNAELMCLQDNFDQQISKLDKKSPHLFVCRSGGRSARAARIALGHGFLQIYNMEGGMLEYCKIHGKP
ncbi:MAG: methyl-accepting chemotaxis protein [Methylococcaceae bacterium]|nr:methyl-accepting chemotaxis protein [Methylococcaceae bacterium]